MFYSPSLTIHQSSRTFFLFFAPAKISYFLLKEVALIETKLQSLTAALSLTSMRTEGGVFYQSPDVLTVQQQEGGGQ